MTLLDDIINASTDTSVATADLLRKVQIVAHRLGSAEVVSWVKSELTGYSADAELPAYRLLEAPVMGVYSGPMRSTIKHLLTVRPDGMDDLWTAELRQPLSEIQALSDLEKDPQREWPTQAVGAYENSGVFTIEWHNLFSAHNVITRQSLKGVLDIVRSKAMEFALELQTDYPQAGSVDGPTIANEPGLSSAVYNVTTNIYGDGANVATGSHIAQRSRVNKGDSQAFRAEVAKLGLSDSDADEFVRLVSEERNLDKPRVRGFLDRVKTGAIVVGGRLASDVVAGSLVELATGFLGA